MSGLSDKRLAEIRRVQQANLSVGDAWPHMAAFRAVDDLLSHVDHLTAEVEKWKVRQVGSAREVWRLREGIERVRGHVHESWLHQGDVGLIEDALDDCDALLSPPTEGETDADA